MFVHSTKKYLSQNVSSRQKITLYIIFLFFPSAIFFPWPFFPLLYFFSPPLSIRPFQCFKYTYFTFVFSNSKAALNNFHRSLSSFKFLVCHFDFLKFFLHVLLQLKILQFSHRMTYFIFFLSILNLH